MYTCMLLGSSLSLNSLTTLSLILIQVAIEIINVMNSFSMNTLTLVTVRKTVNINYYY